ncbi:hypothetical protein Hanom_Chr17g01567751 [Helianthus anomalus]
MVLGHLNVILSVSSFGLGVLLCLICWLQSHTQFYVFIFQFMDFGYTM